MKIGVSSQNFRSITGHAGKGHRFILYETDAQGKLRESERLDLPKEMAMHEFRGTQHPLFALDALITGSCGSGFMRRLGAAGVTVITTSATDPLQAAQALLRGEPLPPAAPHEHD